MSKNFDQFFAQDPAAPLTGDETLVVNQQGVTKGIQHKDFAGPLRRSSTDWILNNPILGLGVWTIETDTLVEKLGDGVKRYIDLPPRNEGGSSGLVFSELPPIDPNILGWVKLSGEIPVSSLTRTNSGKIFFDDITDGDISDWTVLTTPVTVFNDGVHNWIQNNGEIYKLFSHTKPLMLQCKIKNTEASSAYYFGIDLFSGADKYELLAFGANDWSLYDGSTVERSYQPYDNANEHDLALLIFTDRIVARLDGVEIASLKTSAFTNFDKVQLSTSSAPIEGILYRDIALMAGVDIKCHNLPEGYSFKVGGISRLAISGTGTIPANTLIFPLSLAEVINESGQVVGSINLDKDIWSGDQYEY